MFVFYNYIQYYKYWIIDLELLNQIIYWIFDGQKPKSKKTKYCIDVQLDLGTFLYMINIPADESSLPAGEIVGKPRTNQENKKLYFNQIYY